MIFVFGSNLSGIHGAGAAKYAYNHHGALWSKGIGLQGESYAIPTKDYNIKTLPLHIIRLYVKDFIDFAKGHPELEFEVTKIGCGLAGYTPEDIAPLFEGAQEIKNIYLPEEFLRIILKWNKIIDECPGTK
jgi:hypothetical protein